MSWVGSENILVILYYIAFPRKIVDGVWILCGLNRIGGKDGWVWLSG